MIYPKDYEELSRYVEHGKNIFFFTADWCSDCRFIHPQIPVLEQVHADFTFIEVDRDKFMDLAQKWGIFGIPSLVAVENGKELGRFVDKNRKTKEQISDFINNL